MCGRYVTPDEAAMERVYNLTARQWQSWMDEAYRPSYNVAPSQPVPVLRVIRHVGGKRRIDPMRWGLIPFFARGEPPKYSTINAMIEKLDGRRPMDSNRVWPQYAKGSQASKKKRTFRHLQQPIQHQSQHAEPDLLYR